MHVLILAAAQAFLSAADPAPVDESALFGDTNQVVDSATRAASPGDTAGRRTLGLSGNILAFGSETVPRAYFGDFDAARARQSAGAVGDAYLDARLLRGFRAYANLEWDLDATRGDSAVFRVPETFLDANLGRKAWFRVGKQVLQWGPGYFFNPTDLINVERKALVRRLGAREGVFGAKVHVPFGTRANLYGFLDANRVSRSDSLSGAVKAEFLAGRSEMAVMAWDGGGRDAVYGADLSTRLLGLDLVAEAALHSSLRTREFSMTGGLPALKESRRDWQPRLSVGAGRSFDAGGIPDRLMLSAEYYYNRPGSDARRMPFASLLGQAAAAGFTPEQALAAAAAFGAFEPNSYSQHYAAAFANWSRFIRSDLNLSGSALMNLNQSSALLAGVLAYRDINDFGLSLTVYGFAGPRGTEYTLASDGIQVQILAEAPF
jgi:hypothetical protein